MKIVLALLALSGLSSLVVNAQTASIVASVKTTPQATVSEGARPAAKALNAQESRKMSLTQTPLSFEPNIGQSDAKAWFTARGAGYTVDLGNSGAVLRFGASKTGDKSTPIAMEMVDANPAPKAEGEGELPGKDSYFPTSDRKTWFSNIPTYSRVKYSGVYPGIDTVFYGKPNRLEYDFLVQANADPGQIRMKFSGSDEAHIAKDGSLVLRLGKDDVSLLVPVAYQTAADGMQQVVSASYRMEAATAGGPAIVSLSLGHYDHTRPLVIDPALVYTEYVDGYVADVAVDGSGNTYVTGQNANGQGFYVTEYSSTGTVLYNATIGTSQIFPFRIAVDSIGKAYIAGYIYSGATLPTGSNSYKSNVTSEYNGFLLQVAAGGASVPYATYLGGTDVGSSSVQGLSVQTVSGVTYAFVSGYTYSGTFPVTTGVYQGAFTGTQGSNYNGWVARFNPADSGSASLVYSTFLGTVSTQLWAVAADSTGDAYVTGNVNASGFPVTSGAFQYTGYNSSNGGVYVTKLNPAGTALIYSSYLGYGTAYGIAVEGQASPSAYVTGVVGYPDFPTTSGAYQTSYPGGFLTKLNSTGTSEVYSTFLGGPSSEAAGNSVIPWGLSLPYGCQSSCDAYVSGYTTTSDFPAIGAIQGTSTTGGSSAFVVEMAPTGASALLSSYLSGLAGYVTNGILQSNSYGFSPAIAVDSSGNMSVAGNLGGAADFPITVSSSNPDYAFVARIAASSTPYTISTPGSVAFGNVPVGVSTSLYSAPAVVTVRNLSSTAAPISSIVASPASIFSATNGCSGTIPAFGVCPVSINFAPTAAGARAGTISVNSNASDSPMVIAVTGTGVDDAYTVASTSTLTFGPQNVGSTSSPQLVTLTNLGDETATLSIYVPYLGSDYTATDNCPTQLAPGGSCVVEVIFNPTQVGLRQGTLYIQGGGPSISIPLNGTGVASGVGGTISFSAASLQLGTLTVGSTSAYQVVDVENNSNVPFTISSIATSGDFSIYTTNCGTLPVQLGVQAACAVYVTFTPSAAGLRTGNLTFTDSASGSPQSVALSGTGLAAVQTLEFYPSAGANFGDNVPVGIQSGTITIYAQNAGTSPISIDRVVTSGDFGITYNNCNGSSLAGTTQDGTGSLSDCAVNVVFKPTAVGLRTGTLSFIDTASNSPQTVALSGNAIADTGTAAIDPAQLDFSTQAVGTSSAIQYAQIINPGNDTITINSYKTGTGNFSVTNDNCPEMPFGLTPANSCYVEVQFTPTATGALTDLLTVAGSIGTATVALSGSGIAEVKTIGITPVSPMNSGSVVVGQASGANGNSGGQPGDLVSIRNTGTAAVTFSVSPAISGTNAANFTLSNPNGCGNSGTHLQPSASCPMWITFKPTTAGGATATLTFTDDATGTTQSLTLSGTGIASAPTYYLSNNLINFDNETEGFTSATNTFIRFYNNSGASVVLGNAVLSSGFLVPGGNQTCNGQTIANGATCYSYISFAPTTAGLVTGSITFKNSAGTALAAANLTGYAPTPSLSGLLTPATLDFTSSQVVTTTSSYLTTVFTNTSNVPLTLGTITGTNLGAAPTDEFAIYSNGCSPQTLNPGGGCTINITFTPNASGARTGSLTLPVTYTGGTTASFNANFTGTGLSEVDSAVLQPGNGVFVDQTVGVQSPYIVTLYLVNRGNLPFKVSTVVGSNTIVGASSTGEFSAQSAEGGSDGCSGQTLAANTGFCQMNVTFTPSATGTRTGNLMFPVTFADKTTANAVATLSGNGVAAGLSLEFLPGSLEFAPEIINTISPQNYIGVKNVGNKTVHFASIAALSAGFVLGTNQDGCYALSSSNLPPGSTCYIYVSFAPTATGAITGTLTINDNATGGPHKLALTGTAISASQQIALSQTALTFLSQPQSSTSSPQIVYVTNQSASTVSNLVVTLNSTPDYQLTNGCPTTLGGRAVCSLTIKFSPGATSTGTRTASIVVSDSDTGSPRTITLSGTAIVAGPAVALTPPAPLTFTAVQKVGTTSPTKGFSVTNTGTANLTVTNVTMGGTNASEFPIVSDGCSGAVLTPGQNCLLGLQFSPALGGTRTAVASVFDSATGSPQTLSIVGTGYGIPMATLSASSLNYANTYIGSTTAAQTVTLSNPGTDTLKITSIALTGPNTGDFTKPVTTCGSTLSPGATCTISSSFAPTAVGSRTADVTITDNANNVTGSTESVILNGTGLGIPTASLSATVLNFPATYFGTTDATPLTLSVTNTGTAALNVTSVKISGTNAGDFTESNNCGDIAPSGVCTISVNFTPGAVGSRTASLSIVDNSGNVTGASQSATLNGTGAADASVSTTSVAFGSVSFGTTKMVNVTVSNVGTIPNLTVSAASNGSSVVVLSTGNTCTSGVAPGKSCTLPLEYNVTAVGAESNSVTITTNGGSNPVVTTTGTGTSDVSASATTLAFGTITHGTTKTLDLTITNVGTLPSLTVSAAISGTTPADFTVLSTGNTCTSGVAPGASCTLPVEFSPAAAASYTATLTVTTNGGANPVVSLTGTGN